jgi:hypothetical protein
MGNKAFQKALEMVESLPEEQRESLMGRQVPRSPAYSWIGGVKGHNTNNIFISGKPRPYMGVELHIVKRRLIEERRDRLAQSIKEAREEYKRGKIRKGTVDDLMNELSK